LIVGNQQLKVTKRLRQDTFNGRSNIFTEAIAKQSMRLDAPGLKETSEGIFDNKDSRLGQQGLCKGMS